MNHVKVSWLFVWGLFLLQCLESPLGNPCALHICQYQILIIHPFLNTHPFLKQTSASWREEFAPADQSDSHKNHHVHVWILLWGCISLSPPPPSPRQPPLQFYSRRCCWVKLAFVQLSPLRASVSLLSVLMNLAQLSLQVWKRTSEKQKQKNKSRKH